MIDRRHLWRNRRLPQIFGENQMGDNGAGQCRGDRAQRHTQEARVGQRTTLDVVNAQQELVNARVALVTAQHDRVVASYTLLAAVGGLSMQRMGPQRPDLRPDGPLSTSP